MRVQVSVTVLFGCGKELFCLLLDVGFVLPDHINKFFLSLRRNFSMVQFDRDRRILSLKVFDLVGFYTFIQRIRLVYFMLDMFLYFIEIISKIQ